MTDWYQTSLLQRDVIECRIRLGFVPETDHVQAQVEVFDPTTGVIIAQWACPHSGLSQWLALLEEATAKARGYIAQTIEPF